MLKVSNIEVWGFEHALRGMRNPKNSWHKNDSQYVQDGLVTKYRIGPNDLKLARTLIKAGPEHRKFVRQIFVSMDIEAPLYWWKEFDTYKISTTANSCSTMHKIHDKELTLDDFSCEHLDELSLASMQHTLDRLNGNREMFLKTKEKHYWWQMIQLLPTSYMQKRTVTMTYETAYNMEHQRDHHKLDEWHVMVDVIRALPNYQELFGEE